MRRRAFDVCTSSCCDWSKKEMFLALGLQVNSALIISSLEYRLGVSLPRGSLVAATEPCRRLPHRPPQSSAQEPGLEATASFLSQSTCYITPVTDDDDDDLSDSLLSGISGGYGTTKSVPVRVEPRIQYNDENMAVGKKRAGKNRTLKGNSNRIHVRIGLGGGGSGVEWLSIRGAMVRIPATGMGVKWLPERWSGVCGRCMHSAMAKSRALLLVCQCQGILVGVSAQYTLEWRRKFTFTTFLSSISFQVSLPRFLSMPCWLGRKLFAEYFL
jgi:hypothetical protein